MGHLIEFGDEGAAPLGPDAAAILLRADLTWLLKQAFYSLASEIHAAIEPLGVSPRGYYVLETALTGEHTQSEVAETVQLDKTTMVAAMDELEAQGLAERRPAAHDRRARVIVVTDAGRALVQQARETVASIQDEVLASLGEAKGAQMLDGLRELVGARLAEPVACKPPQRRRQPRRS